MISPPQTKMPRRRLNGRTLTALIYYATRKLDRSPTPGWWKHSRYRCCYHTHRKRLYLTVRVQRTEPAAGEGPLE